MLNLSMVFAVLALGARIPTQPTDTFEAGRKGKADAAVMLPGAEPRSGGEVGVYVYHHGTGADTLVAYEVAVEKEKGGRLHRLFPGGPEEHHGRVVWRDPAPGLASPRAGSTLLPQRADTVRANKELSDALVRLFDASVGRMSRDRPMSRDEYGSWLGWTCSADDGYSCCHFPPA